MRKFRFLALGAVALSFSFNSSYQKGFSLDRDHRFRDGNFSATTAFTAAIMTPDRAFVGTSNRGLFESVDAGKSWQHFNVHQIPMRADPENQRRIYAVDSKAQFLTLKHDIMYRAANDWQTLKTDIGKAVIFTAIHRGKKNLYLGTSVNGLKYANFSEDQYQALLKGGKIPEVKFKTMNGGVPGKPHNSSHFIFEEVQGVHEFDDGDVLIATGPAIALYLKKNKAERFQRITVTGLSDALDDCKTLSAVSKDKVVLTCARGVWSGSLAQAQWEFTPIARVAGDAGAFGQLDSDNNQIGYTAFKSSVTKEKSLRMQNASGHRLMYASGFTWSKKQAAVLAELKNDFWTGLVIDGKDDNGIIRYDSEMPVAKAIGAVRPLYKMSEVAEKVHALGKRLVVRLVIFKDPKLFEREGYAIRDAGGGKWIGSPKERWIDPYNPNLLTEYYSPMMKELTERGVDEIQLDYIRFPSDGAVGRCRFSHKKGDYYYSEALENFLTGVRESTHLPIGADIYGYNGMYRVPGAIGQDLEVYGHVVDVIAPMHYSSHFGDDYMRHLPLDERTYQLLKLALSRGTFFARGEFVIRPFIQAFPMKNGLWGYGKKYFADQIRGSSEGGGNGFMFWGMLDHMTLVRKTQTEK